MVSYLIAGAAASQMVADERPASPQEAFAKLERLRQFRDGWAYGEGLAFDEITYTTARLLLTIANGIADVFPGRHGQITVAFYRNEESYDFVIDEKSVRVVHESSDGSERDVTFADAIARLRLGRFAPGSTQFAHHYDARTAIGYTKWNSYEFSTPTNTSLNGSDFGVLPSNRMWTWGTSPSSKKTARWQPQVISVNT